MYLDSAYIAKFYLNEPDADRVRRAIAGATELVSSLWAVVEVTCTFHRKLREGLIGEFEHRELLRGFSEHTDAGLWTLAPVTDRIARRVSSVIHALPATTFIRAGDALHLATAWDLGEREIWTNDRHLLAAAPHFGLVGRSA